MKPKEDRNTRSVALLPTIAQVAAAIDLAVAHWPGRCDEIVHRALSAKLFPKAEARYGSFRGVVAPGTLFATIHFPRHGWLVEPSGTIVDLTRWVFEGVPPYVAVIGQDDRRQREYDVGGIALERAIVGDRPPPGPDATIGRDKAPKPCPLNVTESLAVALVQMHFGCSPVDLTLAQVLWITQRSVKELGAAARPLFLAMERAGVKALVPIDSWNAVVGLP